MRILIAGNPKLTQNYKAALLACRIPFDVTLHPHSLHSYTRLLLPGGGDICPERFGQKNHGSKDMDPALDEAQLTLLDAFVSAGKPVLGICRGLQIINVYFGGTIIQELPTSFSHKYVGHDQIHPAFNTPGSILHKLYGRTCLVNSAHHQGCGITGRGLLSIQSSPDGVTEALIHKTKPILGVQWHPERTGFSFRQPRVADGEKLIRYFSEQM